MAKRRSRPRFEEPQFLNIDLDVRSRRSLTPLVTAWPWAYCPVAGDRFAPRWLIVNPQASAPTAESASQDLLSQIGRLRGRARDCWKQASQRVFDIGVRAPGSAGCAFEDLRLTTETLRRIATVGGEIQVTVYPAEPLDTEPRRRRRK